MRQVQALSCLKIAGYVLAISCIALSKYTVAQDDVSSSDNPVADVESDLKDAPTCAAAAKIMYDNAYGSWADLDLTEIVIDKCEKSFLGKLSSAAKDRYKSDAELCGEEYEMAMAGSMFVSAAAICRVEVAEKYAANPTLADTPMPRASFDCAKAQSSLEKAICGSKALGRADIILSKAYANARKRAKSPDANPDDEDLASLIEEQRQWLSSLSDVCGLKTAPASQATMACLLLEFRLRYSVLLDACDNSDDIASLFEDCHYPLLDPNEAVASFDCNEATDALERVVCASPTIRRLDFLNADSLKESGKTLGRSMRAALDASQKNWKLYLMRNCPLGGGKPSILTLACVRSAYEVRSDQLSECPKKSYAKALTCLNSFRITDP